MDPYEGSGCEEEPKPTKGNHIESGHRPILVATVLEGIAWRKHPPDANDLSHTQHYQKAAARMVQTVLLGCGGARIIHGSTSLRQHLEPSRCRMRQHASQRMYSL